MSAVRLQVLREAMRGERVPDAARVAAQLGDVSEGEVVQAFRALHAAHVYVVEPGAETRLRMANRFSAVPTPFRVEAGGVAAFGNCVWDALGIIALLGGSGLVNTSCPDCGEALQLRVDGGRLEPATAVVHFAVPARHWWDDIVHT